MKKLLVSVLAAGLVLPTPSALALDPSHGANAQKAAVDAKATTIEKTEGNAVALGFAQAEVKRAENTVELHKDDLAVRQKHLAGVDAQIAKRTEGLASFQNPDARDAEAAAIKQLADQKSVLAVGVETSKKQLAKAEADLANAKAHLAAAQEAVNNASNPEQKAALQKALVEAQNRVAVAQNGVTKAEAVAKAVAAAKATPAKAGAKKLPKTSAVK